MFSRTSIVILTVVVAATLLAGAASAAVPHAGMLRYPDVGDKYIAFRYANDIWIVPREGGVATPLTSTPGAESLPKFSPDGETIAFLANYDGNYDIYTMPVGGGTPYRVTHHPSSERPLGWTPDGDIMFWAFGYGDNPNAAVLYTIKPEGGLPTKLPVPYGWNADISADGKWLAYNPFATDYATWKRYRGGRAPDVWLFNLKDYTSKKITDWEGSDTSPMWQGDKVYYVSDEGPAHRLNVWVYDTKTGKKRQVTKHSDYDVKWASIGPGDGGNGEIVYQYGPELRLLDLKSENSRKVNVEIPGDHVQVRPQLFDEAEQVQDGGISSTGKRAVLQARGDIWTIPAENGMPRALVRTDGTVERSPAWSPDGQWVAYLSDADGEYQIYITQSDGRGETKKLTNRKRGFIEELFWSPDSKKIAFFDSGGTLYILDVDSKEVKQIYDRKSGGRGVHVSWSHDSNWLTFADQPTMREINSAVFLYDVPNDKLTQVTSGMFSDTWPCFDREGKFLYYASQKDFSTFTSDDNFDTWVYSNTDRLLCVPLRADVEWPNVPKSDEEEWSKDEDKDEAAADDESAEDADEAKAEDEKEGDEAESEEEKEEPLVIDIDGFEGRAVLLPVGRGAFYSLTVNDGGQLLYMRRMSDGPALLQIADITDKDEPEKTVLSGVSDYDLSADGKKLLAADNQGTLVIVDAAADQSWDEPLSDAGMTAEIDPRVEWLATFNDAWRIMRDYFYDPDMHGVDWEHVREQYEPMVKDCGSRADLSFVIGEMIAELNVGHAYYFGGGDEDRPPSLSVGMLGCDFELDHGAYKISRIYQGGPWDSDARGPLSQPGIDVNEGDYILAVNGVPIDTEQDPWAAFQGLAGMEVVLTVSAEPSMEDSVRYVVVEPTSSEADLRFRAWVEKNRAYVDEKSGGRVAYMYVPDTGASGRNNVARQFLGQIDKDALIVDERWNGGGWSPERFVELFNRHLGSYWAVRDSDVGQPDPAVALYGPKCMLINESAGSGGDSFPFWFREMGVGPLIGTRTWGGLVGLSGNPALADGGYMSVPRFAFYNKDGTWGIEGHGVDPDIEVVDDPALMVNGGDPQLDKAIEVMVEAVKEHPYVPVPKPPYPNRSGMGIRPEDK